MSPVPPPITFSRFLELPVEVRVRIWRYCILVSGHRLQVLPDNWMIIRTLHPQYQLFPAVAHVNRESRFEALNRFCLFVTLDTLCYLPQFRNLCISWPEPAKLSDKALDHVLHMAIDWDSFEADRFSWPARCMRMRELETFSVLHESGNEMVEWQGEEVPAQLKSEFGFSVWSEWWHWALKRGHQPLNRTVFKTLLVKPAALNRLKRSSGRGLSA
jgi:hypothetical protein